MSEPTIHPHKVTKPIQLVAAWLAGLVLVDAMFLAAATAISLENWTHQVLVIAAVLNVPLFLGAIFLLQTKFRAELQEDSFYSDYLSKRTSEVVRIDKNSEQDTRIKRLEEQIEQFSAVTISSSQADAPVEVVSDWSTWLVSLNVLHPQFEQIKNSLAASKIPLNQVFGDVGSVSTPERWAISINRRMPLDLQFKLLRALSDFEFDGFHRWVPLREADEDEDVYIGSYGKEKLIPFSDRFRELLRSGAPSDQINAYIRTARGAA